MNIEDAIQDYDFGTPNALKRGRNPRWPYVPIVIRCGHQHQLPCLAFATREEAIACAADHVARFRIGLKDQLATPRYRALRRQFGLPEELPA